MNPLFASLLHSIWQAGLGWLIVFFAFRFIPAKHCNVRYRFALLVVVGVMVSWLATWTALENRGSKVASFLPPTAFVDSGISDSPVSDSSNPKPPARVVVPFPWQSLLLVGWQVGVAIGFYRIGASVLSARQMSNKAALVRDPRWLEELDQVCAAYGARVLVGLRSCHSVISPVVVGIWKPVILVPAAFLVGVPADALRAALAHEMAHVARRDLLINLFQMGCEALLFFNPFIWTLNRIVRNEREACCDQMASRYCNDSVVYAESLLWWSRQSIEVPLGAVMGIKGGKVGSIRERVARLLFPKQIPRTPFGWIGALLAACGVALLFLMAGEGIRSVVGQLNARERVEAMQRLATPYRFESWRSPSPESYELRRFSGTIVDEAGNPIRGARWIMLPYSSPTSQDGLTKEDGKFSGELPGGLLRLRVTAEGFASVEVRYETTQPAENVKVVLARGIDFVVRCVDEAGAPLTSGEVSLSGVLGRAKVGIVNGLARFSHQPENVISTVNVSSPGYQAERMENVRIVSQAQPLEIALKKAEPFRLSVVDELDGARLKGVKITIVEVWPKNISYAYPWTSLYTDDAGEVFLDGLNPDLTYGLKAEGGGNDHLETRGKTLFRISPGREKQMHLRLPRERRLNLKVTNLEGVGKELTVQYSQRNSDNGWDGKSVQIPIVDGIAETELRSLYPTAVSLHLLGEWSTSPVLKNELTEFTVDYAALRKPEKVKVSLELAAGLLNAPPSGNLDMNWKLANQTRAWEWMTAPIKSGKVEFELPATATFQLRNASLLGGKIDERVEYHVGKAETHLTVPVKAAGMFRVKVLEPSGELANRTFIAGISASESNQEMVTIKNGASPNDAREWFISEPVPLGLKQYRIVASNGSRFVVSPPVRVWRNKPIQDLILTLPEPVEHPIRVVDERGNPAAVNLTVEIHQKGVGRIFGSSTFQTDADGRGSITLGGNTEGVTYTLTPRSGPFAPFAQEVPLSPGKVATLTLMDGKRVAGRIIDQATGIGVPMNRVSWVSEKHKIGSSEITTDQSGRFEFLNAPPETVFLMVPPPLGMEIVGGSKSLYVVPAGEEVVIYVTKKP